MPLHRATALLLSWVFPATTVWASTPLPQRHESRETQTKAGFGGKKEPDPLPRLEAKAPHVILARDRRGPTGVATSPDGRVFFSDWWDGAVFEVVAPGELRLVVDGLRHPR